MFNLGIETFLTVIREKSISSAAAKLHAAQSTISQRLQALEREMGMTLIERSKGVKQIRLTPSGEEFFKLAEQWYHLWQQALILQSQGPKLVLSIGSVDSFNTFFLSNVFRSLNKHQPPVQLTVKSIHSWDLYAAIENRQIDIGFALQQSLYQNVNVTKIFSAPMVALCHSTTREQKTKTIHPTELDPNNEVNVLWGPKFKIWHDRWWNQHAPSRVTIDYVNLALLLISPPQWIIVPLHIANAFLKRRDDYFIYQLTDPPPDYICYKLTHKNPTHLTSQAINIFDGYFTLHLKESLCDS